MPADGQGQEIAEAFVRIRAKTDGVAGDLKKGVEDPIEQLTSKAKKAFAGIAVAGFLKAGIDELGSAQAAAAQTTAALKSTGGAANVTADDLDHLAERLANLAGADKEAVQAGGNLLLTFRNVRNELGDGNDIYDQALTAAQDLSVAFGQDLHSSVILVGKALDNPVQGLTALQRVGVTLSAQQKEQVKDFVAAGDVMAAQKVILEELTKQVGGSAEAFGETLPGEVQRARNALDDMSAAVVGGAAPALEGLLGLVRPVVDGFSALPQPVQTGVVALGAVALVAPKVVEGVGAISDVTAKARDGLDTLALRAMYAKDGLGSAAQGAAGFVTAIGPAGLAGALGVAGLAVLAFTAVQSANADRQREITAGAKEYQAAIEAQTGALVDNENAVTAKKFAEGTLGDILRNTNADIRLLASGIKTNEDALDSWVSAGDGAEDKFTKIAGAVHAAALEGNDFAVELDRLRESLSPGDYLKLLEQLELISTQYKEGKLSSESYDAALEGLGLTTEGVAESTTAAADAAAAAKAQFDREAQAAKDAQTALDGLLQSTDDLFGANLSLQESEIATRRALESYAATMADGAKSADDRTQAGLDVLGAMQHEADAAADAAAKQAELDGRHWDAAESAKVQRDKLAELATTLAPGSELRAQLDGFIGQLDAVIARKFIQVQIQTIAPNALPVGSVKGMSDQDYLLYILGEQGLLQRGLDGGLYRTDTGERVKAAGGPAMGGSRYEVSEPGYGPEIYEEGGKRYLIPGASGGWVTDADDTARMTAGGGFNIYGGLHITAPNPERAAQLTTRRLRELTFLRNR